MSMVYAGYARLTRPLLQSEVARSFTHMHADPPVPKGLEELSTEVLQWDGVPMYSVTRDDGRTRLIFNDYSRDQLDPNYVELRPFAFVVEDPERPREPFVVQAESARIRFDGEFDPLSQRKVRIIEGTLASRTTIVGPDGIAIEGTTFVITENLLYSDFPVRFTFGPTVEQGRDYLRVRGRAGDITVQLRTAGPGEQGLVGKELPAWTGIDSLGLRKDVQIEILSDQSRPGRARKPDHLTIACDGRFRYVVDRKQATFEDNVRVVHSNSLTGEGLALPDVVHELGDCQKLVLHLEQIDREAPTLANLSLALALRRVEAIGPSGLSVAGDEKTQLRLSSYEDNLTAFCDTLNYDLIAREAILAAARNTFSTVGQFVAVRLAGQELFCPVVRVQTDDDDELVKASFPGPGFLRTRTDTTASDIPAMQANWSREVVIDPAISDAGQPQMRLTAIGDVRLQLPAEQTLVTSPHVECRLDEATLQSLESRDSSGEATRENPLRYVFAKDGARIERPDLNVQARKAFELLVLPVDQVTDPIQQASATSELNESSDTTANTAASDANPVQATADTISVAIGTSGRESELLGMTAESRVEVIQASPEDADTPRFRVRGDRATLTGRGLAQELTLTGNAATLQADGVALAASTVTADRASGVITVPGRGTLRIPIAGDLQGTLSTTDSSTARPSSVTIEWAERVEFRGQTVRFFGDVVVKDGDRGNTTIRCQELDARLTRAINLGGLDPQGLGELRSTEVDLQKLTFRHNVQVSSEEWAGTELVSLRTVELHDLAYDRVTGQINGTGPGVIKQWSLEEPEEGDDAKATTARPQYRLAKVSFVGDVDGDANRGWLRLSRDVRALSGFVDRALVDLTRDDLLDRPNQSLDAFWIGCDTLEVSLDQTAATTNASDGEADAIESIDLSRLQLQAVGHVEIEGPQYRAIADTASVNRTTGLITIRSSGGKDAAIWRQATPGATPTMSRARAFRINPEKRTFEVDEAAGFWGGR